MCINIVFLIFRHDCGILVLNYLEKWEALKRFNGKTMPPYSSISSLTFKLFTLMQMLFYPIPWNIIFFPQEELQHFRQQYACEWILDPENIHRETVLQKFKPFVYK